MANPYYKLFLRSLMGTAIILVASPGTGIPLIIIASRNWDSLNNHSKRQLLKLETPETESGRSLIYVCPECADIGCGAFGCKITKKDGIYIWSDFAYENGYEDPKLIQGIGPFDFKEKEYENVIEEAFAL
jgi:hypothetical protein